MKKANTPKNVIADRSIAKDVNGKSEKPESELNFSDFSDATIKKAFEMLKARGITKAAKRPSGEYLYLRPRNIDDALRDAIQKFMTENKNASVHDMAEYALCKLLGVKVRESVAKALAK